MLPEIVTDKTGHIIGVILKMPGGEYEASKMEMGKMVTRRFFTGLDDARQWICDLDYAQEGCGEWPNTPSKTL